MNKEILQTLGVLALIYVADYLLLPNVIGTLANIIVPIYGLNLVKKQKILAIKTVFIVLMIFNLGIMGYILFGNTF